MLYTRMAAVCQSEKFGCRIHKENTDRPFHVVAKPTDPIKTVRIDNPDSPLARVGLPTLRSTIYVHVSEILYCKGESSQTSVYMLNQKSLIINRTLKECETALTSLGFCRIHKSYLVNIQHIRVIHRNEAKAVDLVDGTRLDISATFKEALKQVLVTI